jgi:hypothetical protein
MCLKDIRLHAQNIIISLGWIVNITTMSTHTGGGFGGLYVYRQAIEIPHFDYEQYIRMNNKKHDESNYGLDLGLLIAS